MKQVFEQATHVIRVLALIAAIALASCATKQDVENIISESNAQLLAGEFAQEAQTEEKILDFIERNPDLAGINQRLLVRLAVIYANDKNANLARAALDKANTMGSVEQLGDRDALIVSLREPLVWQLTDPKADEASKHLSSTHDYLSKNRSLHPQIHAMALSIEVTAARSMLREYNLNGPTEGVRALREDLTTFLEDFGGFWGEEPQKTTVQTLRAASSQSCPEVPAQVDFTRIEADQLSDLSLLRYAGSVMCNVEKVMTSYSGLMAAFEFTDQPLGGDTEEQRKLRADLTEPDWITCTRKATSGFDCNVKPKSQ